MVDEKSLFQDFEARLGQWLDSRELDPHAKEPLKYVFSTGGKRTRPICTGFLAHIGKEAGYGASHDWFPAALAVELIHTYSLVHDDLPCMDDDDTRRGMPTVHRKFSESTAVLLGDGMIPLAFDVIARAYRPDIAMPLISQLAQASGLSGLVLGQFLDLDEGLELSVDSIREVHRYKTGCLFELSMFAGGLLGGIDAELCRWLGLHVGLVFQAVDDLLDEDVVQSGTGDSKSLLRVLDRKAIEELIHRDMAQLRDGLQRLPDCETRGRFISYLEGLVRRRF